MTTIYNSSEGPVEIATMHPARVIKARDKLLREFNPAKAKELLALHQAADRNAVDWLEKNPSDEEAFIAVAILFCSIGLNGQEAGAAAAHIRSNSQ